MPSFVLHHYIKQEQSASYIKHKLQSESSKGTLILQINFTENYSPFYQDKIQSAHWHKTQILMFTAAIRQCGECMPAERNLTQGNQC